MSDTNFSEDHILESISPTFYKQLWRQLPFQQNLLTQTERTQKLQKSVWQKNAVCKMSVKVTPAVNFTNILQASFAPISFCPKNTNLSRKYKKSRSKDFHTKKNFDESDTWNPPKRRQTAKQQKNSDGSTVMTDNWEQNLLQTETFPIFIVFFNTRHFHLKQIIC